MATRPKPYKLKPVCMTLDPLVAKDAAARSVNRSKAYNSAYLRYMRLMSEGHQELIEAMGQDMIMRAIRAVRHNTLFEIKERSGIRLPHDMDEIGAILQHLQWADDELYRAFENLPIRLIYSFLDLAERYYRDSAVKSAM